MNTSSELSRRLVLREFPADDEVGAYAEARGWRYLGRTEQTEGESFGETIVEMTWEVEPDVVLLYVEDGLTWNCFVQVEAGDPERAEHLLSGMARDLDVIPLEELLSAVERERDPDELARAVNRLTLGAPPEPDDRVVARVADVLRHPEPDVRRLAIWAMLHTPWPQYRPLLRHVLATDEDQAVRETAEDMLATYDEAGVGEP
ncbi:HEAT repeat-containing protein [Streptoalloteichus tenebrarius]|uniref:HEAT repeat-containing protein n=1 Tax=Streptoalloteichus tenebrarius (strain ATCC 17920 / DSM 40477 / JCM 4838 / CBS 697.72 / NBRC 16177 / NCIMB 11028 / NRRL B-12390 / A12253. 1 / ISP 5477) TaxID=1933 RepID=A0ABT1HUF5_STRSD|nr:HEAT repeat domain-containing protein [Streptoalloteichus tenebrarius]MCP2259149.1 HEAT repeat-containing protein [Streptoalloteichus tenebrarius]BFF04375.1 hypothetical protein GCM10020241_60500 [Streptoalloteichus tenebrarius]